VADGPLPEAAFNAWQERAFRIALGVELVAHMEPIVDEERLLVGYCVGSPELAAQIVAAIALENVGAQVARAHPGEPDQPLACDVILPCRPEATDEEVEQAVLAAVKSGHALLCPINTANASSQPAPSRAQT
jgi:hypothetical protein